MKTIVPLILCLLLLIANGCETPNNSTHLDLLMKNWVHVYEEDQDGVMVYRPNGYTIFAISRYRNSFVFKPDNVCEYTVLAPNDAHYTKSGTWRYNETTNRLKIFNQASEIVYDFEVALISKNKLTLKTSTL